MGEIKINIDQEEADKKLEELKKIKNGTVKAMKSALNRTVSGMKTDSWEQAKKRYTIKKKKDFDDKLKAEKATSNELSIALRSTGRPMRSIKFAYRKNRASSKKSEHIGQSFRRAGRFRERGKDENPRKSGSGGWNRGKKPVFLHVEKGKSGSHLTGAFMANFTPGKDPSAGDNSLTGIFARTGRGKKIVTKGKYKGTRREPIKQKYSPGSVQMLQNKNIEEAITKKATERFNKELDHQIKYLLDKQKG